ncbi:Stk1 family PASTA domain-containing Ser/Thr kinase [Catelliglobosispora koreensis]|uniref:Stk1 family PASTA domain-containing Ser/Thr kinase n=1 Tax=Catelliglobosispora koreensis TaxID=129052 RepID=UPI000475E9A2|nr:Stk1 family PASTA domain-containing Ser/Thr kinase [Catelliglobosispora koreensis]
MNTQVADPLLGSLIDARYRVRSRVARGGMATVYTAVDERLERTVALKIIHPGQVRDASFVDRFTDEAKTIARLTHPNVVAVYDQGTHSGLPYLVMEYVRGRTLRDILTDRRRLAPAEALAVMEQVLSALAAAHHAGLVHRDVKPENVLVAESPASSSLVDAVVKVADFGLARAVEASAEDPEAGHLMATVAYVAPELVADGLSDPRSDVYSAGVMLFEMLTGRVPYDGERPVDVAWQHVDRDVPPPSKFVAALPPSIDDLVSKATRRDPSERPTDAGALLSSIQGAREGLAHGNAATQRIRPIVQPTVVVSQIDRERPSWARLPAPERERDSGRDRPRPRRKQQLTLGEQVRQWHRQIMRSPRNRNILAGTMALVLLLILAGGYWLAFGRFETTPNFVQMSREQAEAMATEAGLKIETDAGVFNEEIKKGTVLAQNPPAGEKISKGGTIVLTLSNGPERYVVPGVGGKSVDAAKADLEQLKFTVKEGPQKFSDTVPAGIVLETIPPEGQELKPGSEVQLIVSKGRAPITVPSVVGKQVNEATAELQALGLTVVHELDNTSTAPRGEVIEQTPPAGSGAERNQQVKLKVSNNPNMTAMPEVRNMYCDQATAHLQAAGFEVEVRGLNFPGVPVRDQNPNAGQPVRPGQKVTITCRI